MNQTWRPSIGSGFFRIYCIHKPKNGKVDEFRSTENINLGLNSAKSIGCTVVNIGQGDIKEGRGHLVLA